MKSVGGWHRAKNIQSIKNQEGYFLSRWLQKWRSKSLPVIDHSSPVHANAIHVSVNLTDEKLQEKVSTLEEMDEGMDPVKNMNSIKNNATKNKEEGISESMNLREVLICSRFRFHSALNMNNNSKSKESQGPVEEPAFLRRYAPLPQWVEMSLAQFKSPHWRFDEKIIRQWSWRSTRERTGIAEMTVLGTILGYFITLPVLTIGSFAIMSGLGLVGGLIVIPLMFWSGYVLMSTAEAVNSKTGSLWQHLSWGGRWELFKRSLSLSHQKIAALWEKRSMQDIEAEMEALQQFSKLLEQHEPETVRTGQDWWVTEKKVLELMERGIEVPHHWQRAFQVLHYWPKGFIEWVDKKWSEEVFEKELSCGKLRSVLIQERIQGSLGLSHQGSVWADPWQEQYEKELEFPIKNLLSMDSKVEPEMGVTPLSTTEQKALQR